MSDIDFEHRCVSMLEGQSIRQGRLLPAHRRLECYNIRYVHSTSLANLIVKEVGSDLISNQARRGLSFIIITVIERAAGKKRDAGEKDRHNLCQALPASCTPGNYPTTC